VAAGAYPDIHAAADAMGRVHRNVYRPIPENAAAYDQLFEEYRLLHDYFGRGANDVMHRLKERRRAVHLESAGGTGDGASTKREEIEAGAR
jgi:L-ribulokinase